MKHLLQKLFGGINLTWPRLIIFSLAMGAYTALMAALVPDNNSFHDIAVYPWAWVLPALFVVINCKKPLEAALKTLVFFLISQPLVYLLQVPFNSLGWGLFSYYGYWFIITLFTFPVAFMAWYIKKDKWYSAIILSAATILLLFAGIEYCFQLPEHFPDHILSIAFCFASVPLLIFVLLKDKLPRLISIIINVVAAIIICIATSAQTSPYETYNNSFIEENNITFIGEPYISYWSGSGAGNVEIIKSESGYMFKLSGSGNDTFYFKITDDENTYAFKYYFDKDQQTVIISPAN